MIPEVVEGFLLFFSEVEYLTSTKSSDTDSDHDPAPGILTEFLRHRDRANC